MSSGLFYLISWDRSISNTNVFGQFLLLFCFTEIPVVNANSADPDEFAASDLCLHCLLMPLLWELARHKWVHSGIFMCGCCQRCLAYHNRRAIILGEPQLN